MTAKDTESFAGNHVEECGIVEKTVFYNLRRKVEALITLI